MVEVAMCKEVEVMLKRTMGEESDSDLLDTKSDKLRTAVKYHLTS